jgi:hypothetical protein
MLNGPKQLTYSARYVRICAVNHFKPKLVLIIFEYSVLTCKKTQPITITRTKWLTLFKEMFAVYSENHIVPINALCVQNVELFIVNAGGTYSYH